VQSVCVERPGVGTEVRTCFIASLGHWASAVSARGQGLLNVIEDEELGVTLAAAVR